MNKKPSVPYRGQMLLALLLSLFLSSALLVVMIRFYVQIQWQNKKAFALLQLQSELQQAVQLMTKDIKRAGFRAQSDKVLQDNFSLFETTDGKAIQLFASSSSLPFDCVLFFYDLDTSGCIGESLKGKHCQRQGYNQTQHIERELFGYRLNNGMLESRLTYKSAVNSRCKLSECQGYLSQQACQYGGWVDLLDAQQYQITALRFDWVAEQQGIDVYLKGVSKLFPDLEYETRSLIPLLNQG
ncbi:hypothetical protein [Pasteurella sp. PK-2025]|uniref:hypothetical protein n=1 Tax=Pasteurella sp. PK-2025 TaxID=3413133 RepID=UPI003C775FA1